MAVAGWEPSGFVGSQDGLTDVGVGAALQATLRPLTEVPGDMDEAVSDGYGGYCSIA